MIAMADRDTSALRTLSDVVRERRQELKLSLRELADRCVDSETGAIIKFGWINRLEKDVPELTAPKAPELRALAAGLSLPLATLQEAAGVQFHGVTTRWSGSSKTRAFVNRFEELPPEDQERVLAMLEAYASAQPPQK
ncbi:helix-turn-helix domain-containing protein [Streptomyces sp. NPDC059534]|uniref:helix-turn-helix domain-containing protein n=1 Tax=Streptomyces sp. NPDC059534 TaxID=3346859 RepID=UPI00367CF933